VISFVAEALQRPPEVAEHGLRVDPRDGGGINSSAEAYGNQFPSYRDNPIRETLRAVEDLAGDPGYARRFGEFQRLIV
jgi:hypothetical protein